MNKAANFRKTVLELKRYLALPIQNDRDRAGIIQAFELTFEQSWKAVQKVASAQGIEIANPKRAFGYAMQNGWIPQSDEALWLQLLRDRNLTRHTYQQALAKEILDRIAGQYVSMFESLLSALESQKD